MDEWGKSHVNQTRLMECILYYTQALSHKVNSVSILSNPNSMHYLEGVHGKGPNLSENLG